MKLVAAGIVLNISKVLHSQYVPVLKNHRDGLRELSGRYLKKVPTLSGGRHFVATGGHL